MRKLANVLKAVPLLDFKGKILKPEDKATIFNYIFYKKRTTLVITVIRDNLYVAQQVSKICDGRLRRVFPYHRVTFTNYMDLVCFQFNWLFLVQTLLKNTSDFNSTTISEQP